MEKVFKDAKFDGLAAQYDKARPRYPVQLFEYVLSNFPFSPYRIIDAGAGTGIALETLLPLLTTSYKITAIDISVDMIRRGEEKFPQVEWIVGKAEEYLQEVKNVDLVIAAQAYQWMNRSQFLSAAASSLNDKGMLAIVQNNRNFKAGGFPEQYEVLLETYSPGYSRSYRSFDIRKELSDVFPQVEVQECDWVQDISIENFITMTTSSTQAQRAIKNIGDEFISHVRRLCEKYAQDNILHLPYKSEGYYGAFS